MCGFCHSTRLIEPLIDTGRSTSYSATTEWWAVAPVAASTPAMTTENFQGWRIGRSRDGFAGSLNHRLGAGVVAVASLHECASISTRPAVDGSVSAPPRRP